MLLNEPIASTDAGHTRVVAPDYATAVRILQDRFGSDWTVVQSRKVRRPGFFGWFGVSDVVVIIRTEESMFFQSQENTVVSSSGKLAPLAKGSCRVPEFISESIPDLVPVVSGNFETSQESGTLVYRLEGARSKIAEELEVYSRSIDTQHSQSAPSSPQQMMTREELSAEVNENFDPAPITSFEENRGIIVEDPVFIGAVKSLCEVAGFSSAAQNRILEMVCCDPIGDQMKKEQYQSLARERVAACVAARIPETCPISVASSGEPKVVALVGPTGVGKTTTLAKLAAQFHLVEKKRVGMVTLDCYRIGAVEQLRRFAEILGLPLKTVSEPGAAAEAIKGFSDCDVILVDTAGRSQRDLDRLTEVKESLSNIGEVEVHLCLSLAAAPEAIMATAESFRVVGYQRVIFTKKDESYRKGFLWDLFGVSQAPVSYVTCGQEVPEDIQAATRDSICEMVLEGR